MKRLELRGMNTDQLRKVWENNELENEVMDDMAECEMLYIGEQLNVLRPHLSSWSVGQCNRDQHIIVRDGQADGFITGMKKLQNDFCLLGDEYTAKVDKALEMIDEFHEVNQIDDDADYLDNLEEKIERTAQALADDLRDYYTELLDDYCLDRNHALEYFLEFYADERMDGDEYVLIDENGESDWELYKDIAYTKKWA